MKLSILIIGILSVFLLVQTASAYSLKAHAILSNHIAGDSGVVGGLSRETFLSTAQSRHTPFHNSIAMDDPGTSGIAIGDPGVNSNLDRKQKLWTPSSFRAVNNPGVKKTANSEVVVITSIATNEGKIAQRKSGSVIILDRASGRSIPENSIDRTINNNMTSSALKKGTVKFFND